MNAQSHMSGQFSGQFSGQVPNQSSNQFPGLPQQSGNLFNSQVQNPSALTNPPVMDTEVIRIRRFMREKIYEILMLRQSQPSELFSKKCQDFTKRLEDGLFKSVTTKEEYMNMDTLEARLQALVKRSTLTNNAPQQSQFANTTLPVATMMPTPGLQHNGNSNAMVSAVNPSHPTLMTTNQGGVLPSSTPSSGSLKPNVNGSFSGMPGGSFRGGEDLPVPKVSRGPDTIIQRLYELPVEERSFPTVLDLLQGEDEEDVQEEQEEQAEPPIEREPQPALMSSARASKSKPSTAMDTIEKAKRRRLAKAQSGAEGSSKQVAAVSSSPCSKPVQRPIPTIDLSDGISLTFDDKFGSPADGFASLWPDVHKLAFPAYMSRLESKTPGQLASHASCLAFQVLQTSLHAGSHLESMEGAIRKLEEEKDVLSKKLKASEGKARQSVELASKLRVANYQLARVQDVNRSFSEQLTAQEAKVAVLKENFAELSGYYTWLAKIECIEAYNRGEHVDWDAAAERAEFEEFYSNKPSTGFSDAEDGDAMEEDEAAAQGGVDVGVEEEAPAVEETVAALVDVQPSQETELLEFAGTQASLTGDVQLAGDKA